MLKIGKTRRNGFWRGRIYMIEKEAWSLNGILGMIIIGILAICAVLSFLHHHYVVALLLVIITLFFITSFTFIYPNEAKLITFYHGYVGTIRKHGFIFTIPLTKKRTISLRNESIHLKDITIYGTDNETWAVHLYIQYKVVDTAKALYEVENYHSYMEEQSVAAIKILMTSQLSDGTKNQFEKNLPQTMKDLLQEEIQQRVDRIGLEVVEANITNIKKDG